MESLYHLKCKERKSQSFQILQSFNIKAGAHTHTSYIQLPLLLLWSDYDQGETTSNFSHFIDLVVLFHTIWHNFDEKALSNAWQHLQHLSKPYVYFTYSTVSQTAPTYKSTEKGYTSGKDKVDEEQKVKRSASDAR